MTMVMIVEDGEAHQLDEKQLTQEELQAAKDGDLAIYKWTGSVFAYAEVGEEDADEGEEEPDLFIEWEFVAADRRFKL